MAAVFNRLRGQHLQGIAGDAVIAQAWPDAANAVQFLNPLHWIAVHGVGQIVHPLGD